MSETSISGFGCAICSDVFIVHSERNICTIPRCGHVYHECCVKRWFLTQIQQGIPSNCPKCRAPAQENEIIRLFLHQTNSDANDDTGGDDEQNHDNDNNNDNANDEESDTDFEFDADVIPRTPEPEVVDAHAHVPDRPGDTFFLDNDFAIDFTHSLDGW